MFLPFYNRSDDVHVRWMKPVTNKDVVRHCESSFILITTEIPDERIGVY